MDGFDLFATGNTSVCPGVGDGSEFRTHHRALHSRCCELRNVVGVVTRHRPQRRGGRVAQEGAYGGESQERVDLHHGVEGYEMEMKV